MVRRSHRRSRPAWARGLKFDGRWGDHRKGERSRPAWARGLKYLEPKQRSAKVLGELARVVGFELRVKRHLPMLDELLRDLARYAEQHGDGDSQTIH